MIKREGERERDMTNSVKTKINDQTLTNIFYNANTHDINNLLYWTPAIFSVLSSFLTLFLVFTIIL